MHTQNQFQMSDVPKVDPWVFWPWNGHCSRIHSDHRVLAQHVQITVMQTNSHDNEARLARLNVVQYRELQIKGRSIVDNKQQTSMRHNI